MLYAIFHGNIFHGNNDLAELKKSNWSTYKKGRQKFDIF